MALHRLKPLLGPFEHIDAAIEAAAGADGCRDEFRSARACIVQMICDAAVCDNEKVEGLCALLDEAMAGSLATLLVVPAEKTELVSDGLVSAVDDLMREHPSERVRGLAGDVVRGWRAAAKIEIARARAKLDALPSSPPPPPPHDDTAPAAKSDSTAKKIPEEQPRSCPRTVFSSSSRRVSTAESYAALPTKKSAPIAVATISANRRRRTWEPAKKTPPVVVSTSSGKPSVSMEAATFVPAQPKKTPLVIVRSIAEEKKLEVTKRKLHERYQEAEDAKRRRKIQVIEPPRPPPATMSQTQRIVHSGVRARGPASCASERIFHKSCSLRMRI